ncbi:CPBP family intramembrane glutamic endopeptidase [Staphylospora marina]|uniref:CPBP family intramembrane glutamic endopeptidase n=1 Tax=Staphylospora marina TaxID=2490858 RepID=UPI0013DDFFA4|nr:CPBP family intramembrane glutamic endopeptidase [Staphylospora marina]
MKPSLEKKDVLIAFYGTQLPLLGIGIWLLWRKGSLHAGYFAFGDIQMWVWGLAAGVAVILADLWLMRVVPISHWDDGGINRLLFQNTPGWQILLIAVIAAFSEEILFRGVLLDWIGLWGSSLLFVLMHTRYLRKWLLVTVVAVVGLLFGWMTERTGHLAPAIMAHFLVDAVMGFLYRNLSDKEGSADSP